MRENEFLSVRATGIMFGIMVAAILAMCFYSVVI